MTEPTMTEPTTAEPARLCHQLGLRDLSPEADFDDLTELVARVFGARISLVSLVDDDLVHFKSHHGLRATSASREGSFCGHVVDSAQPLVVPDATQDPRFALTPVVVTDPFVRFYAGVPIVVDDVAVGTLCVMDPTPRPRLTETQVDTLRMLGRQVVAQLQLRRQARVLEQEVVERRRAEREREQALVSVRRSERRVRGLFDHSPVGLVEATIDGVLLEVNATLCTMLGYARHELLGMPAAALLHDDEERGRQHADLSALPRTGSYTVRRRYRRRDGTPIDVQVAVALATDVETGRPRVLTTVTDIGEQVRAEERLAAAHEELLRRTLFTDAVLDSIDVGIVACDEDGRLTVFNRATQGWHGVTFDAETGADPEKFGSTFALYDGDGTTELTPDRVPLLRALRQGSVHGAQIVIAPEGRPATLVECTGRSMVDEQGRLLGAVVAMNDITVARAQQAALLASETRSRAIFDNDPAALVLFTVDGRVVQANPAVGTILGLSPAQVERVASVDELLAEEEQDAVRGLVVRALRSDGAPVSAEQELRTRDGRRVWCLLTVTDLPDPELGHCLLLQAEDVTLRRAAEQQLAHQAQYDSLTDLPNRATTAERIRAAVARLERRGEGAVHALFCDLDGFKAVNDTYGHAAGDHLLVEVARRLHATVRSGDTVGRLGGDEFLVICEDLDGGDEITRLASRVAETIAVPVPWQGHSLSVTASIGIARADGSTEPEELVRRADAAMYRAKRLGKDRYVLDDEDARQAVSLV